MFSFFLRLIILQTLLFRDYDGKVTSEEAASAAMYVKDHPDKEGIQELISNLSKDKVNTWCAGFHNGLFVEARATGVVGYVLTSSFLIRENILALITINSGFFVFLLHLLYSVFLTRLGMRDSLRLPNWLEKAL